MPDASLQVLHFDDDPDDAVRVLAHLEDARTFAAKVCTVELLVDGLRRLRAQRFDLVLLKLDLPDSRGVDTFDRLNREAPDIPMIVLGSARDDNLATEVLRRGAQDFLALPNLSAEHLSRSIAFAIERHRCALELNRRASRLQEAENRIRKIIEASADAVIIVDVDGLVRFANPAAGTIFDRDAASMVGQPFGFPIATDRTTELDILRRDGTTRIAEMRVVETRWCDHIAFLASLRDITERRHLEAQLERAQRMDSLGSLAGGIAHDLNNVLAPIMMSVEVLRDARLAVEADALLRIVAENARRGADMVRQILTFAGGTNNAREPIDCRDFVREVAGILNDTLLKSVEISTSVPPDLWAIEGHRTQLHQVFINLGVNARDAMSHGGVLNLKVRNVSLDDTLTRLTPEATPGPHVVFSVSDTGPGIHPDIIDRIFEPFFTTKQPGLGSGLGLSAVRGIVKSHGGFIKVDSRLGHGSTFEIYLPARPPVKEIRPADPSADLQRGAGELVLVVDDEAAIRQMTQYTLEAYGYRALLASDGRQALTLFAQHQTEVAVVLTDMMMPSMDGETTIRALRSTGSRLRIIAASGLATDSQRLTAMRAGADLFLPKPFTARDFLIALHRVLRLTTCDGTPT